MLGLLIGTDVAIIAKLYKMKVLGKERRPVEISPRTVTNHPTGPLFPRPSQNNLMKNTTATRSKTTIDIRLALAFLYITVAFIIMTLYFRYIYIVPYSIMPYTNFVVFNLELSKCTVYVLIVTQK
ncbi:unnamed protein product, partial [Mesorhabditis spiculigera]